MLLESGNALPAVEDERNTIGPTVDALMSSPASDDTLETILLKKHDASANVYESLVRLGLNTNKADDDDELCPGCSMRWTSLLTTVASIMTLTSCC